MDRDLRLLGKLHGESLNERAFIELLLGVRLCFGREGLRACRMLGTEPWEVGDEYCAPSVFGTCVCEREVLSTYCGLGPWVGELLSTSCAPGTEQGALGEQMYKERL